MGSMAILQTEPSAARKDVTFTLSCTEVPIRLTAGLVVVQEVD